MENQTHGKTAKSNDNQTKTQAIDKKLLSPKTGILNQARLRPLHNIVKSKRSDKT